MTTIHAYHFATHQPVKVTIDGPTIVSVEQSTPPARESFIGPAFWDIQTNGRWGRSFSDSSITVDQVVDIIRAHAALGTARLLPTLITAPQDAMLHGVRTIAQACATHPDVERMVVGIHLEGPAISELDGYRGAHPAEHVRDPSLVELEALQTAAGGRIKLITLAPERAGAIEFIAAATAAKIVIALGHTACDDMKTFLAAERAGARLSTHLGNGAAATMRRHPNPIWCQLGLEELSASFIADGEHVDLATLATLIRCKGWDRSILISDFSPLAGQVPGRYGNWEVETSGRIAVAGTPYLAGANADLITGLSHLQSRSIDTHFDRLFATVTTNPARLLGHSAPRLEPGEPANLVHFAHDRSQPLKSLSLISTCVDGVWHPMIGSGA